MPTPTRPALATTTVTRLTALLASAALFLPAAAGTAQAQQTALTVADSTLIYEILSAEERRDASATALTRGATHADARVRHLARRATARIADSTFAARDSLGRPDDRALPNWPLPEWADRFRALTPRGSSCDALYQASTDSAIQVRLRGIALAGAQADCRSHPRMKARLRELVVALPENTSTRRPPAGSWHEAAAALVPLALLSPDSVRLEIERFARHAQPQVRRAAARAAVVTRDTAMLVVLSNDADGNVAEAAIAGLARVAGHAFDALFTQRLSHPQPQVALAAAEALKGSPAAATLPSARDVLAANQQRNVASERDVRVALRRLLGDSTPEPWSLRQPTPLPREVVALALGQRRYIQVQSSTAHGAGSFTVELRGDVAPIMAARVLARVRAGEYNGQRWHRVEPGFVIQGGSRFDNEYAGAPYFLVDELGTVAHPRGSVGMSTRGHDTGDAQWFINLRDNARLVGDYTVFAMVIDGMAVIDNVLEGDEFTVMREVSDTRRRARP